MTRRELEDRVFDLMDLEASDPVGVLQAAASVRGGWWYFQRMKDAVALAKLLPMEEPPAGLDLAVLALSSTR